MHSGVTGTGARRKPVCLFTEPLKSQYMETTNSFEDHKQLRESNVSSSNGSARKNIDNTISSVRTAGKERHMATVRRMLTNLTSFLCPLVHAYVLLHKS